jgi:hypothetical protein
MSPDQWLASQQEEKPKGAKAIIESAPITELSPDQWLATQKTKTPETKTFKEPTWAAQVDKWIAQRGAPNKDTEESVLYGTKLTPSEEPSPYKAPTSLAEAIKGPDVSEIPKINVSAMPSETDRVKESYEITPNMDLLNTTGTYGKRMLKKGAIGIEQGYGGIAVFAQDMLGVEDRGIKARLDHLSNIEKTIGNPDNYAMKITEGAVSSITQQLPLLLGGVATGSAIIPLTGMFIQSFGQTYDDSRRSGLDIGDSTGRAAAFGAFEVIGEKLGLGAVMQGIKAASKGVPLKELAGYFAKALLLEIPGEQLTYAGQFAVDKGYGMNPEAGVKEFIQGAIDTFASTVVQGGIMLGGASTANKIINEVNKSAKNKIPTAQELMEQKGFIVQGGKEYARTKFNDGTSQLGISNIGTSGETPGRIGGLDETGLDVSGERSRDNNGRKGAINDQLNELIGKQEQYAKFDPADPRIFEIDDTIKELKTELQNIDLTPAPKEKAYNAPGQEAFDFNALPKEEAGVVPPIKPEEFGLVAPTGTTGVTTEAKPLEQPTFPTSKFMLVNTGNNPTKGLASFFNSIKPATNTEGETVAHKAEVNKLFEDINNFYSDAVGKDRDSRLKTVRDFFDQYSIAPEANQNAVSNLSKQLVGMDAQTQQNVLNEVSQLPKINTVRGMKELRNQLQETITNYSEAKLMRHRENAVLPYGQTVESIESITSEKDRNALQNLSNISDKYLSPEEKAAKNYFSAHADYDNPFLSAIRAAAFDLGAEIDPNAKFKGEQFKGQNLEAAQQFRNWVSKNLDKNTLARFDVTVEDFRKQSEKANRNDVARWDSDQLRISINRKEVSKEGAMKFGGWKMGKRTYVMHPSVETRIANNDLPGALRAVAKVGNEFQKGLSRKLLALNLTTTISVGKQDAFSQHLIKKNALNERTELVDLLKADFPTVFADHFSRLNDVKATLQSLSLLRDGKLKVPQETVNAYYGQIEIVFETYQAASAVLDASGTYMVGLDSININRDRGGNTTATFLHEVLHAATHWAIDPVNYATLDKNQKQAVDELNRMYNIAKTMGTHGNELNSLDEFIVEAFTNPEFQAFLRTIPVANTKQTLWDKFVKLIAKVFGLQNMLGYTLANANTILQAPPNNSTEARALNQKNKNSGYALNKTFHVGPEARTFLNKVFSGAPTWAKVRHGVPELLRSMTETNRKRFLYLLTPRMMQDISHYNLPSLEEYVIETEKMSVDRNRIQEKIGKITKKWSSWQKKNPGLATILNNLMIDSSRKFIDPSKNNSDLELNAAWKNIGDTGHEIYIEVRDFFSDRRNAFNTAVLNNIKNNLMAGGKMTEAEVKADPLYVEAKAQQDKHVIDPYFPFKRFGQFWYQINSAGGKIKEFQQFESEQERTDTLNKRREQLERTDSSDVIKQGNSIKEAVNANLQNLHALENIKKMITAGQGQSTTKLKENLINDAEELYLSLLPDQSVRKLFNRQGIPGVNPDMLRAFSSTAAHLAYQQARFQHSNELFRHLQKAKAYLNGMPDKEALPLRDYIAAFEKNLDFVLNPPSTSWAVSAASDASFVYYLSSIASAFVNVLGIISTAFPTVQARYGATKTSQKMLVEYPAKFLTAGFTNSDGDWAFPSLKNNFNSLSKVQQDAFIALENMFNITLTHDIAGLASAPSKTYTGGWSLFMKIISAVFHGAEKFNREVVGMTVFDLAYERAIAGGVKPERAFEKAVAEAKELTYKSMGDFSTENKPEILQNQAAKIILQYKQFGLTALYLIIRSGIEGFGGNFKKTDTFKSLTEEITALQDSNDLDSKNKIKILTSRLNKRKDVGVYLNHQLALDDKALLTSEVLLDGNKNPNYKPKQDLDAAVTKHMIAFKKEGMDKLIGILAINTVLFHGVTGMFGWSAFSSLMEVMRHMWADDDEKEAPFNFDNWFKNWVIKLFGGADGNAISKFAGNVVTRGAISTATGVNIADRMSFNGMLFRDPRSTGDEVSTVQAYFIAALGPVAGFLLDTLPNAVKQYNDGHFSRAIETALPAFPKNIVKATRFATEGAVSLSGNVLIPDFSAKEIGAQAIGFAPERLTRIQKANIETKNAEQDIIKRHDDLLNAFFMAIDTKDKDMQKRILRKIGRFNIANPGKAITSEGIGKSIERRYEGRAMARGTGGIHIDKKLIGQLHGMQDYAKTKTPTVSLSPDEWLATQKTKD